MNYIERNLRKDEKIITQAKISFWGIVPSILFAVILISIGIILKNLSFEKPNPSEELSSILLNFLIKAFSFLKNIIFYFFIAVSIIGIVLRIVLLVTTRLVITNKRVLGKRGILSIDAMDLPIEKVDNVSYSSDIVGNLFHIYTISIQSTTAKFSFPCVSNALQFKNSLTDAIDKHAEDLQKAQAAELAAAMNKNN